MPDVKYAKEYSYKDGRVISGIAFTGKLSQLSQFHINFVISYVLITFMLINI